MKPIMIMFCLAGLLVAACGASTPGDDGGTGGSGGMMGGGSGGGGGGAGGGGGGVPNDDDAGTDGGPSEDAGLRNTCLGNGSCVGLRDISCRAAQILGCEPQYTSRCEPRGDCTGSTSQANMGACVAAGACVWEDGGCRPNPACLTATTESSCLSANCVWAGIFSYCAGTYECSRIPPDAGFTEQTCRSYGSTFALACY